MTSVEGPTGKQLKPAILPKDSCPFSNQPAPLACLEGKGSGDSSRGKFGLRCLNAMLTDSTGCELGRGALLVPWRLKEISTLGTAASDCRGEGTRLPPCGQSWDDLGPPRQQRMNWKGLFLGVASAPVLAWIPRGCAKEQLRCMLDRIPAYKCFLLLLFCTLSLAVSGSGATPPPPPHPTFTATLAENVAVSHSRCAPISCSESGLLIVLWDGEGFCLLGSPHRGCEQWLYQLRPA